MSLSIKYSLDARRAKGDKTFPLVLRVIINRKTIQVPTGYSLLKEEWDHKNQQVKPKGRSIDVTSNKLNNFLATRSVQVREYITDLREKDRLTITPPDEIRNSIKEILGGIVNHKMDLFEFMNKQMKMMVEAKQLGSYKVHKNLFDKLSNYTKSDFLPFAKIDYDFLVKFEANHFKNGANRGSLSVYLRTLRAIYNKAIKSGLVDEKFYPFKTFSIKNGVPKKRALNESDFKLVMNAKLNDSSAIGIGRNYYMASFMLRGMNWMDMCYLKRENFSKDWKTVTYVRRKTQKPLTIGVLPELITVIKKLRNDKPIGKKDYVFPVIDDSLDQMEQSIKIMNRRKKINSYLKDLANKLEIDPFTIYSARHTWATLGKFMGMPTNIIQESLGHATEEMTQTYLNSFGNEVVDEYAEQMFKKLKLE